MSVHVTAKHEEINAHLSPEEQEAEKHRQQLAQLGFKTVLGGVTYPLTFAKTLFQLGYEPYALTPGKTFVVFGRDAWYLPNAFVYLRNVYRDYGLRKIYTGIEAGITANLVGGFTAYGVSMYLDKYYPEIGGEPKGTEKTEAEMTHLESAQVKFRQAVRDSIAHTAAVVISRPFTVIMVREIAQHVGGEWKYPDMIRSLFRIGHEEGPAGFFSGLMPQLVAEFIVIWGVAALRYATGRLLENVVANADEKDENTEKAANNVRSLMDHAIPFLVSSISYPFNAVSTVMAVNGSGLAVSLLPYAPLFSHWNDAYTYLKPHGLVRGARLFMREQKGAVTVGPDRRLYASNKHFV